MYFYPRSPCGERHIRITHNPGPGYFYPRSPCGERLLIDLVDSPIAKISIHALLAESDPIRLPKPLIIPISIHALLAESDHTRTYTGPLAHYFYPRSPCGERPGKARSGSSTMIFLSTLSLRRATAELTTLVNKLFISIHALLAESDPLTLLMVVIPISFLSTLSLRRATQAKTLKIAAHSISIHALLAESDVGVICIT